MLDLLWSSMNLTNQDITEYMRAWYEAFGEWLSWDEATLEANQTMELFLLLYEVGGPMLRQRIALERSGLLTIEAIPSPIKYASLWQKIEGSIPVRVNEVVPSAAQKYDNRKPLVQRLSRSSNPIGMD